MKKCGLGLVNYRPLPNKVITSENNKFIARMEWGKGAIVYELQGKDYKYRGTVELVESLPAHIFISNEGDLIAYGKRRLFLTGIAQSDIVYIYKNLGETLKTINAEMVFSEKEIQESIAKYEKSYDCTPIKPWICHSEDPEINDNELKIKDTLNRSIRISIDTMNIDVSEPYGSCDLLNENT